jgi:hypothetical protein
MKVTFLNLIPIPYKKEDHLFRYIMVRHTPVYLRCHVGALEFAMEVSASLLSHYLSMF